MVLITIFFSLIRPHHSLVYAPKLKYADKKHAPPPVGKGIFAWVGPLFKTNEDTIVEKVGLDAAIFLRFTRMLRNMFLILSLIGCGILIPVHVLKVNQGIVPKGGRTFISSMTPLQVQGSPMWAHVVVAYLFTITVLFFLWMNWRAVVRLRRNYFESKAYQNSLHSRTVWMIDIPRESRSDEGILKIVDSVESTASLPHPAIARNVKELPELIDEHTETVQLLESILAKYLKNPDRLPPNRPTMRPSKKDHRADRSGKVDAIDYLTGRIKDLEVEIKDVRESIDKRNPMSYGFATYDRIEEAHTVAYAARTKGPKGVSIRLTPKPNDFIWQNLHLPKKTRARKRFVMNLWVALLTLIWIAPNAFIAIFLVNLSHLGALWPAFQTSFNGNFKFWSAVQAILGPALLSLVYILLPIFFRRMSTRAGDLTKTSRERHVTHKLYAFFVFNNLIVFSIFSAVWSFVAAVIDNTNKNGKDVWSAMKDADLPNSIMTTLCTVSVFWLTWILQRNIGAAADLGQLLQLFWTWFARTFMSPTPRQHIEWTAPQPFDYSVYYNYYLFTITVALTNATLQPLVLPVTCLYIGIEIWLKKYLLLYVFITKTESGGQFWNLLSNRILFGSFLSQCIEALVIKGAGGSYTMLFCLVPLPFVVLAFKWYTMRFFEDQCKYYIKASIKDPENMVTAGKTKRSDRLGIKFGHPALYKPLITPMVHAKAKHLLGQIYRGRLDGTDDVFGSTDIAMDRMSEDRPGKASDGAASNMFEVVSEAELDFAYFKNRADFGDEHGGSGELYGRPMDLISERSGTPKSFMTGSDDERSNAGTPPPMPLRQQRPDELVNHPAFRRPSGSQFYKNQNDSGRSLLGSAQQPPGYAPLSRTQTGTPQHEIPEHELYGMDRWRTGGTGYAAYHGQAEDDTGYESYRTEGQPGYGPGRGYNPAQGYDGYR